MEYFAGEPKVLTINLLPKRCIYISKPDIVLVDWTKNENGRYDVRIKVNGVETYAVNDSDIEVYLITVVFAFNRIGDEK